MGLDLTYVIRMPPSFWANEEQLAFLRSRCHDFSDAQKRKTLAKFWNTLDCDWFEKWPEAGTDTIEAGEHQEELGKRIEKRKKVSFCRFRSLTIYSENNFSNSSLGLAITPTGIAGRDA
jgi:hypothetical protein